MSMDDLVQLIKNPSIEHRPELRWWLAEGLHTDETLRFEIHTAHRLGFGGMEFLAMDEGNIDHSRYGWGAASVDGVSGREAQRRIELITAEVEVGQIYDGKVARLMDFGAFVTIMPGKDGLVHVSQISDERVERVSDKLKEGDSVRVKVLEVDRQGRIRLSMRNVS